MDREERIEIKRHDEILKGLGKINTSIQSTVKNDDDAKIIAAINEQSNLIKSLLKAYQENEAKEIKVEVKENNGEKIVTSFEVIAKGILDKLDDLKSELSKPTQKTVTEWVHTISERDYHGRAAKIISTQKNK